MLLLLNWSIPGLVAFHAPRCDPGFAVRMRGTQPGALPRDCPHTVAAASELPRIGAGGWPVGGQALAPDRALADPDGTVAAWPSPRPSALPARPAGAFHARGPPPAVA
jgi:hypothetical protein